MRTKGFRGECEYQNLYNFFMSLIVAFYFLIPQYKRLLVVYFFSSKNESNTSGYAYTCVVLGSGTVSSNYKP